MAASGGRAIGVHVRVVHGWRGVAGGWTTNRVEPDGSSSTSFGRRYPLLPRSSRSKSSVVRTRGEYARLSVTTPVCPSRLSARSSQVEASSRFQRSVHVRSLFSFSWIAIAYADVVMAGHAQAERPCVHAKRPRSAWAAPLRRKQGACGSVRFL